MKNVILSAVLAAGLASPALAESDAGRTSNQSVYRTVETTTITNDDGSVSQHTVTTVYYLFGYE